MESTDHCKQKCLYEEWMYIQEQELLELQQAARLQEEGNYNEANLNQLIEKIVTNFQEYIEKRCRLARRDVTPYFAPTWCSSLENSGLWIGGCRPSSYIRLIYALCGLDIESHLAEFHRGSRTGNIGDLSATGCDSEESGYDCDENRDLNNALDKQDQAMASVLEEADALRLNTVKEIIKVFTPAQTLDFLAAGKKLRLCMQEWGKKRDHEHGRN
ncbi:hypothetical protein ACH5RR_015325 [Cinchona calisaya]|uniref:DOG1 domain-containing protein n=1 Tax=Cinchona calisaya TaxID=153742 RepID=A0ABD2ZUM0_9GENT